MKVIHRILAGMVGLAEPAFAAACADLQATTRNVFILSNAPPPQGRVAAFVVLEKGTDSDGYSTFHYQFDRCGTLSSASSVFYRDYGATQMLVRGAIKLHRDGWQAQESMAVTVQGALLTQGTSDIRYDTDELGRIVRRLEHVDIDGSPGKNHTTYHFDSQHRLIRAHTASTHSFFDETREFTYDKSGRLVRVSSAKGTWQLMWHEDGRWLSSSREVNHPYSVQETVRVCEQWDERNNCLRGTVSETEKYARESLQTRYAFTQAFQYD